MASTKKTKMRLLAVPIPLQVPGRWRPKRAAMSIKGIEVHHYAKVCTITGPAIAVAGPASSGVRFCSIHASARLFNSSAPA